MRQVEFYVALAVAPGIGPARFNLLLKHFNSPKQVWDLPATTLIKILGPKISTSFIQYRQKTDPGDLLESIDAQQIKVVLETEDDYPKLLKQTEGHPPVLFIKGDLIKSDRKAIGVVGSRKVTSYGREVTESLVSDLVAAGFTIVSGLARGVDSIAARTALKQGGRTIAVLGGGMSRIYPPENFELAKEITQAGALVSEYAPDTPSTPGNFPARNRIISGLSLGVLVTEAGEDSGSLITASLAAEQGREVFAVPGPIYSKLAHGPAKLIKEGAKLVASIDDILEELNLEKTALTKNKELVKGDSVEEQVLIDLLTDEPNHVDQLILKSKFQAAKVSSLLSVLEIKGKVKALGNGKFSLNY
jgi:DNA processing protein